MCLVASSSLDIHESDEQTRSGSVSPDVNDVFEDEKETIEKLRSSPFERRKEVESCESHDPMTGVSAARAPTTLISNACFARKSAAKGASRCWMHTIWSAWSGRFVMAGLVSFTFAVVD